jgi:HEAT repeat protein
MISRLLRSRESALRSKVIELLYKQSFVRIHITTQTERHDQAIAGCYALGPVAKPLVPEVAKALKHLANQPFAEQWLQELGPDAEAAIPALVEILRDKKNVVRFMAAQNLAHIAIHRQEEVLPVLNECLQDTNNLVRYEAGLALKILEDEASIEAMARRGVQ